MHRRIIPYASRQHRAKGDLFRTPREGRPYGQTDKPHTVGRGLAPAETFGDSLQAERLTKSRRGELCSPVLPCQCAVVRYRAKGNLRAPSAPSGHLPRKGEVYMGRFVNRPYRNYSLFISEAASLFNIHSSHVSSRLPPGNTVSHIHRSKKPPLPKGG